MSLTEEDKKRLEEEEAYREKVREEGVYREQIRIDRNKIPWWKPSGTGGWIGLIFLISMILLVVVLNNTTSSTTNMNKVNFNDLSRQRFDDILTASPELESIECLDGNCTSVVYFNFRKLPDDLEYMIRANTVTFSNFKYENTGTSNISIFATYNGRTLLQCDGGQGKVKDCKK